MRRNVVGSVALNFVLWIVLGRVMGVAFIVEIGGMDGLNRPADPAGFRVPGHMIANFEFLRHTYAPIFNPERVNVQSSAPMPNKPKMSAAPFVPRSDNLERLSRAAQVCEGCDLYRNATQTVFGEGSAHARVMLVGEQPGNEEDREGSPFVGPAGRILNQALEEAEVDRSDLYVTNAVKHFKFEPRGKRRLHKKPSVPEITACRPWLEAEIAAIHPELIVCLGATAARSVLGRDVKVTVERGELRPHEWAKASLVTVHPSALLRIEDKERKHAEWELFIRDLRKVHTWLEEHGAGHRRAH